MKNIHYILSKFSVALSLSVLICEFTGAEETPKTKTDPFVFCTKFCNLPGPCDQQSTQAECLKVCTPEIWQNVAAAELKETSEEFRSEKDPAKKKQMLYGSKIAQCLSLSKDKNLSDPMNTRKQEKNDLCKAAVKSHEENFGPIPEFALGKS